eukprot:bmy_17685T0
MSHLDAIEHVSRDLTNLQMNKKIPWKKYQILYQSLTPASAERSFLPWQYPMDISLLITKLVIVLTQKEIFHGIRECKDTIGLVDCSEKPSFHCPRDGLPVHCSHGSVCLLRRHGLGLLHCRSPRTGPFFFVCCIGSPVCPTMSDTAMDTSSEIITKDLKEKKEVVEEVNGEQEAASEVEEGGKGVEEGEGGRGEEEGGMKTRRLRQLWANGQLKVTRMTVLTPRSRKLMSLNAVRNSNNADGENASEADLWLLNSCTVKNPAEDHFRNSINGEFDVTSEKLTKGKSPIKLAVGFLDALLNHCYKPPREGMWYSFRSNEKATCFGENRTCVPLGSSPPYNCQFFLLVLRSCFSDFFFMLSNKYDVLQCFYKVESRYRCDLFSVIKIICDLSLFEQGGTGMFFIEPLKYLITKYYKGLNWYKCFIKDNKVLYTNFTQMLHDFGCSCSLSHVKALAPAAAVVPVVTCSSTALFLQKSDGGDKGELKGKPCCLNTKKIVLKNMIALFQAYEPEQSLLNKKNRIKAQEENKKIVLAGCVPQAQPRQDYLKGLSIIGDLFNSSLCLQFTVVDTYKLHKARDFVQQIDRVVEVVEETIKVKRVLSKAQFPDSFAFTLFRVLLAILFCANIKTFFVILEGFKELECHLLLGLLSLLSSPGAYDDLKIVVISCTNNAVRMEEKLPLQPKTLEMHAVVKKPLEAMPSNSSKHFVEKHLATKGEEIRSSHKINRDQSGPKLPTLICRLELVCTSREGGRGPKKAQEKVKGHSVRLLGQKKDNGKRLGGARLDLPKIRKNPLIEIISINTGIFLPLSKPVPSFPPALLQLCCHWLSFLLPYRPPLVHPPRCRQRPGTVEEDIWLFPKNPWGLSVDFVNLSRTNVWPSLWKIHKPGLIKLRDY